MEGWRWFWTVFCGLGTLSFAVLVVVVAPAGWRDLRRMFAALDGRAGPGAGKPGGTREPPGTSPSTPSR